MDMDLKCEEKSVKCMDNIIILSDHDEDAAEDVETPLPFLQQQEQQQQLVQQKKRKFPSRQTSKIFRRTHSKSTKRKVRRLIKKSGKSTLIRSTIPFKKYRYFLDLGNTLVNSRWRWTIIFLTASFVLTWLMFACFWMLISISNGDLDEFNPSDEPCLTGISGFPGFFLFSLETQATIGYGSRYINHHCPEGTFIMVVQIIMGSAICGGMVSIVYVKMARPLKMHYQKLFSSNAVICQRDGEFCLIFRIRDEDNRHLVGTTIDAYIVENTENEPVLYSLHLEPPGLLIWPLEVVHKITEESPFWDFSAKDLIYKKFEMIVTMQGTSVTTGQCSKIRTSYLSNEILWGRRFKPCVHFDTERRTYYVDNSQFNETEEVLTPLCSAQRMEEVISDIQTPKLRPNFFSNYEQASSNLDLTRLQRRRSTIVLTEINKCVELLDASDSESEIQISTPKIIISDENAQEEDLDFNSKEKLSSENLNLHLNNEEEIKERKISTASNSIAGGNKPKRKISFGTRVHLISDSNPKYFSSTSSSSSRSNSLSLPSSEESQHLLLTNNTRIQEIQIQQEKVNDMSLNTNNTRNCECVELQPLLSHSLSQSHDDGKQNEASGDENKYLPCAENTTYNTEKDTPSSSFNSSTLINNTNNVNTCFSSTNPLYNNEEIESPRGAWGRGQPLGENLREQQQQIENKYKEENVDDEKIPPEVPQRKVFYTNLNANNSSLKVNESVQSYLDDIKSKVLYAKPLEALQHHPPLPPQRWASSRPRQNVEQRIDIEELIKNLENYVNENL